MKTTETHKYCPLCKTLKPHSEFTKNKAFRLATYCTECKSKYDKSYWEGSARRYNQHHYKNLREAVLVKLGGRCANPGCGWVNSDGTRGCIDFRCLQIDHVKGGGNAERKEIRVWGVFKKALTDMNGEYQALCANCNWIKKNINNEL